MRWVLFILILISVFLISGCHREPEKLCGDNCGDEELKYDKAPIISATVNPSNNIFLGEKFTLTITAEYNKGIEKLYFESSKRFLNYEKTEEFNCNLQKICSNTWELIADEEGLYEIKTYAVYSSRQEPGKITVSVNVELPEKVCGDNCDVEIIPEPEVIPEPKKTKPFFTCANGICEGGESYESCPQDCDLSDIIGTSPADGACEPGEDITNAPKDCTVINPKCGNNICDEGETRLTCYADCEVDSSESDGESCTTDSSCGYRQACVSGNCITVQCTTDAQCTGCRRCSSNRCVSCGYGPDGWCTC